MIEEWEKEAFGKGMLSLRIIWGAMAMSLVAYLALGLVMGGGIPVALGAGVLAVARTVLFALAFGALAAAVYLRRLALEGRVSLPSRGEATALSALSRYLTATVLTLLMLEGVGLLGFALAVLGGGRWDFGALIFVSAAGMVHYAPRESELVALSEKMRLRGTYDHGGER